MKVPINVLQYPTNITEPRSFLYDCNVHRTFVPNFIREIDTLNKLLKKGALTRFDLNENEHAAVAERKKNLTQEPDLALFDIDQPFRI